VAACGSELHYVRLLRHGKDGSFTTQWSKVSISHVSQVGRGPVSLLSFRNRIVACSGNVVVELAYNADTGAMWITKSTQLSLSPADYRVDLREVIITKMAKFHP